MYRSAERINANNIIIEKCNKTKQAEWKEFKYVVPNSTTLSRFEFSYHFR